MLDPNTARLLILLDRPGSGHELLPEDRAALEATLARDPDLAAFAQRYRTQEAQFAQNLRAVPVPEAAKARTLEHLLLTRSRLVWRRRAWAATATLTLLTTGAITWGVSHQLRPRFDTLQVAIQNERNIEGPQSEVFAWLTERGHPPTLAADWDFGRYLAHGHETIQGVEVPVVTFILNSPGQRTDYAKVYIVPQSRFHIDQLRDAQSSLTMTTVLRDADQPRYAFVVVHTTPNLAPFLRAPRDFTRAG
jgi:hypothetical protein